MPAFALSRPASVALSAELSATGDVMAEESPLSWASSMAYLELKEIPGQTQKDFAAWAESVLPGTWESGSATSYWRNVIDGFSDGDYDPVAQKLYWFGGGHSDSPSNALFAFDPSSLAWEVVIAPVPWAKFPTAYKTTGTTASFMNPVIYPNTTDQFYYFQTTATLDAADASLGAAQEAPISRHTYGSVTAWGGKVHLHFPTTATADVATGTWEKLLATDPPAPSGTEDPYPKNLSNAYGQQIVDGGWSTDTHCLGPNTWAATDPYTGLVYANLNNGNLRSGFIRIDMDGPTVQAKIMGSDQPYSRVGTDATNVYVLITIRNGDPTYAEQTGTYSQGTYNAMVVADKATNTHTYYPLTGDFLSLPAGNVEMEEIPTGFDGQYFWLLPYYTEPGFVYRIDTQTRVSTKLTLNVTGSFPTIKLRYKLHYIPDAGAFIFPASSTAGWWAIKI